jgi:hypothetical protein
VGVLLWGSVGVVAVRLGYENRLGLLDDAITKCAAPSKSGAIHHG